MKMDYKTIVFSVLCMITACVAETRNNVRQQSTKDKNIFYTHDKPKRCAYENVVSNHTFILNKQAGVFTHLGHTRDIHQCKQMCCQVLDCDVAFMPENHCYGVSCYSDKHCETTPATEETFNVKLVKVRRVVIPTPDDIAEEEIIRSSLPQRIKEERRNETRNQGTFTDVRSKFLQRCLTECIFDNMALYFKCRINENIILQTIFLAIFPTG